MTNEDIGLSIKTLKDYTSGMIVRCKEAVALSVDSLLHQPTYLNHSLYQMTV